MNSWKFPILVCSFLLLIAIQARAQSTLAFARELPTCNLNNDAGANRSNVAWSFGNDWITGDDFTLGVAGETYIITKIVGWNVTGTPGTSELSDRFDSVSLYGGPADGVTPMMTLATGNVLSNSLNSNPNITHSREQYLGGADYQGSSGSYIQIWRTQFAGLTWVVNGGTKYNFSADGILKTGVVYNWFNHASNAPLSCSQQDGPDGLFIGFDRTDLATAWYWNSDNVGDGGDGGWDKSSDLNVEIWAEKLGEGMATGGGWFIPESASIVGLADDGSKASFGFIARNRKSVASGNLEFQYHSPDGINLKSSSYEWAQIGTSQALFEGAGTINGTGDYKFRVRAVDGDKLGGGISDRFEIRIWTTGGSFDAPFYRAEGDLSGGQIVVHKK